MAIVLLLSSIPACGLKTDPRPPEDILPVPIADLGAADTGEGILLSWSRPREAADGARIEDLAGFVVERALGEGGFETLTRIAVGDRDRFRKEKRFRHLDTTTSVGTAYRYRVVSFTLDGYFSAPSNIADGRHETATEEKHAPLPAAQR